MEHTKKLGWFLCWAVVFADIGTSLYYVPGILFGQVGSLSGLFVCLTSLVFILLTLKYIEISDRYPEGGGVVTVATRAFGPWFGALGGMFITVDYFLTASISSVSGVSYLSSVIPIGHYLVILAVIGIIMLGILNIIGIKESAGVTALIAIAAFIVDIILVGFVATQIGPLGWHTIFASLTQVKSLTPWAIITGFAGSFLAFSGLESISQLAPAMSLPRKKTAGIAMLLVVVTVLITSPFLTLFSTNILNAKATGSNETILQEVSKVPEREQLLIHTKNVQKRTILEHEITQGNDYSAKFISELGAQYGGIFLKLAVVVTASILLLFAANTAIIGAYHVFIALSRQNFLPHFFQSHNDKFSTPHWAVLLAVSVPVIVDVATNGNIDLLGKLYAFGLLGAFSLDSVGIDIIRWKEGRRFDILFLLGIFTSFFVLLAWGTNLYNKPLATIFGGGITIFGMIVAFVVYKYFPQKEAAPVALATISDIQKNQILLPVFGEFDPSLFSFAGDYAKSLGKSITLLYIREFTDILQTVKETIDQDDEAKKFVQRAENALEKLGVMYNVFYATTNDSGEIINEYRAKTDPVLTILSPHKQSLLMDFLHGDIVKTVMQFKDGNVLIHMGNTPIA